MMNMHVSRLGSGRRFELPPNIEQEEIAKVGDEYRRLLGELADERARVNRLEESRTVAVDKDRRALARALREGRSDPGERAVAKANRDILAGQRRVEALTLAVAECEAELTATVEKHRAEWERSIEQTVGERRKTLAEAVENLAVQHRELSVALADSTWLAQFPDRPLWRPANAPVPSLQGRHGDPYSVEQVLDALRHLAAPPAARPGLFVREGQPVQGLSVA